MAEFPGKIQKYLAGGARHFDLSAKVLVIGSSSVGKSSIVQRITDKIHDPKR